MLWVVCVMERFNKMYVCYTLHVDSMHSLHSLAAVWAVTHSLAVALSVSVLPSCENVVFQLPV